MTAERTINQLLADRGIETRPSKHASHKELWRGEAFLGDFTARAAVERFLNDGEALAA